MLERDLKNYLKKLYEYSDAQDSSFEEFIPDSQNIQLISNLIQGLLLEYLAQQLCYKYAIKEESVEKALMNVIMVVLQDEFFSRFRIEVRKNPDILYGILKETVEVIGTKHPFNLLTKLFLLILPKYFSTDLHLLQWKIESNLNTRNFLQASMY